jgi:hypothetical protein
MRHVRPPALRAIAGSPLRMATTGRTRQRRPAVSGKPAARGKSARGASRAFSAFSSAWATSAATASAARSAPGVPVMLATPRAVAVAKRGP